MPRITFIDSLGETVEVEATPGRSVMECGVDHGVSGILAECGGSSACATCQVYVDDNWNQLLPGPSDLEIEIVNRPPLSGRTVRLSCQIDVTDDLDGITIEVPYSQH